MSGLELMLVLAASFPSLASAAALNDSVWGYFRGSLQVKWLVGPSEDQRWNRIELLSDLLFVEADSSSWLAPSGSVSDGATIPRPLWSLVGSPYTGPYLPAAVIHDAGCFRKDMPWERTHLAFYHAMRASGVPEFQARVMFAAVYWFGPRWASSRTVSIRAENAGLAREHSRLETERVRVAELRKLPAGTRVSISNRVGTTADSLGVKQHDIDTLIQFLPPPALVDTTGVRSLLVAFGVDSTAASDVQLLRDVRALGARSR